MPSKRLARMAAMILGTAIAAAPLALAREKWPAQTEASKHEAALTATHEQQIWQEIEPQIQAWAKKGKPYVPWAAKPADLPQADIPAFPGAEGGGRFSFGGRGGKVYVVTSLEDSGPGTFRQACEAAGPRIVVFNVAGIIHLKRRIRVRAPYITIAGQTAPGDGVCIAGDTFGVETHDVVIRHMRFRRGSMDVYNRNDSLGGNPVGNIIVDHCSASWGFDENLSMYRHMYDPPDGSKELKLPTVNITIQWSISSEALDTYNHAFGGTWGGLNCSFHHNLFACNTGRNPSIGMGHDFNFVNNVLFNWRHRTVDGGDETSRGNIINNFYKPGPVTPLGQPISYRIVKPEFKRGKNLTHPEPGKFYVSGNIVDGNEKVTKDNWDGGVQLEPPVYASGSVDMAALLKEARLDEQVPMAPIPIQPAKQAYDAVLAHAGATLPKRDPVDVRIIDEVRSGKATAGPKHDGILTDIKQVGGYPQYKGTPAKDSDSDGMPDSWEIKCGLNPNDASDASKDLNGDGYTNIEKYINGLDPTKKIDWKDPKNNVDPLMANDGRPLAQAGADSSTVILAADQKPAEHASSGDADAEYTRAINKRADRAVAALKLNDPDKAAEVHGMIVAQYGALRDWDAANDATLKSKSASADAKAKAVASRQQLHDQFISKLSSVLSPVQVDTIKDQMTYNVVEVTYKAYCDELPQLTDAQKQYIHQQLVEAREFAMDQGSSKAKHAVFGKYKGRINNYLAKQGYDLKRAEKEWRARIKARAAKQQ
jgi:hypothetical protein